MPVRKITLKGIAGFRHGKYGKFYPVRKYGEEGAKKKAAAQGAAIHISQVKASSRARGYERRIQ